MFYQSGDDPQLLSDVRQALKRWHKSTLGDAPLAQRLPDVERRRAASSRLTRSAALRETLREALASLQRSGQEQHAVLLERRYLRDRPIPLLTATYHLGERTLYNRLREAIVALAHQVWVMERERAQSDASSLAPAEPSPAQRRSRHLPPATHTGLLGGTELLAQLQEWLDDRDGHWMVCLDGMGGLGKTTLAREAASRLAQTDRFADIAWLTVESQPYSLHGPLPSFQPALACIEVLGAVAHQLWDMDVSSLPMPVKRDRLRGLLKARPYLVVVDNLAMVDDCRELLDMFWELAHPSKFLLTGRHQLQPGSYPWSVMTVKQLDEPDVLALIRHEARQRGLKDVAEAGDDSLQPILAVTGGNPLAIKLVVGQLVSLPLNRVLLGLETVQPASAEFYQYLYSTSWDLLSEPAKHLLMQMDRLPSSGGTWEELAAISELPPTELTAAIAELTAHSLLQGAGFDPKTYCIHPLTRHFVVSQDGSPARFQAVS